MYLVVLPFPNVLGSIEFEGAETITPMSDRQEEQNSLQQMQG
jgi:hypothetical protein